MTTHPLPQPIDGEPPALWLERLAADQQARWQRGEGLAVEDYIEHVPGLRDDADTVLDLVLGEWLARQETGPEPSADEFLRRFPEYESDLRPQLLLEEELSVTQFLDADQEPAEPPLPKRIGRYEIRGLLGAGGMGCVYRAFDPLLGGEVALKVPRLDGPDADSRRGRFLREARAAMRLRHANLCPIHDVAEADGTPYLTMPLFPGLNLAEVARRERPMAQRRAAELVRTLARAMHEAHRAGVVHRDLKPANVLFDEHGEPVVLDFGLAVLPTLGDVRLTEAGQVIGTVSYMAPEQLRGRPDAAGPPADVYSLGVILYELLTGRLPFEGESMDVLLDVGNEQKAAPKPSNHRPDLDPALEAICLRALAKRPAERFASMEAFAADLDKYLVGRGAGRRVLGRMVRSRRFLLAAMVLLAVVLGGAAYLALAGRKPPPAAPVARPTYSTGDVLAAVHEHLRNTPRADRPFQRYFSLLNLHADPSVSDGALRDARIALVEVLNGLSWEPSLAAPALLLDGTVLAIDLRDAGWDTHTWRDLLAEYPYGLKYDGPTATEVYHWAGTELPIVRADWFVAAASRPPLYHRLLGLPERFADLQERLKAAEREAWDGQAHPGVADGPRTQERWPTGHRGGLWRNGDAAGGEVLFDLPNGLLAYMIVDAAGNRLDAAPPERARDPQQSGGDAQLVNGVSCIACHAGGARPAAVEPEVLARRLREDEERFRTARARVIERYGPPDSAAAVAVVVRTFRGEVGLETAARELGLADPEALRTAIREKERLREIGLAPLADGDTVPRAVWESRERVVSPYQEAGGEVGAGTPRR